MIFSRALTEIYRLLRGFADWHEENDLWITFGELVIALFGILLFVNEYLEFTTWQFVKDIEAAGEMTSLCIIAGSIIARFAIRLRGSHLGHDFGALLHGPKRRGSFSTDEELFGELIGCCPNEGYLGALISAGGDTRKIVLERFAKVSASHYSLRTYGEADPMWKTWEERYLTDWLAQFSAAVWRVPPDNPTGGAGSGYFSVMVPVTEDAWKKIRYGHLSTALAAIDERAVAYFNSPRTEPYMSPLHIVAYGLNYVPTGRKNDSYHPLKLLYAGVEHLAYLLREFNAPPSDVKVATFSMICESPNESLEMVLDTMGFAPVLVDQHYDIERTHIRKSQAGFRLFEVVFKGGMPVVGEPGKAGRFRDLLCEIGHRGSCAPAPVEMPMPAVLAGDA